MNDEIKRLKQENEPVKEAHRRKVEWITIGVASVIVIVGLAVSIYGMFYGDQAMKSVFQTIFSSVIGAGVGGLLKSSYKK